LRSDRRSSRAADAPRLGPAAILLVLLMAAGSILMWLAAPIGIIWFAAHTASKVGSPTMTPLLLVAVALPAVMVTIAYVLGKLDRKFSEKTGYHPNARPIATPWNKGMTESARRRTTILDVVMVVSVVGAGALAAILWALFTRVSV
jgi:hypothetical protein